MGGAALSANTALSSVKQWFFQFLRLEMAFLAGFWLAIWLGINTGPWVFRSAPVGLRDWGHLIRTTFPLALIPICLFWVISRGRPVPLAGPAKLWLLYGLFALVVAGQAVIGVDDHLYWTACYLSVFAVCWAWVQDTNPLERVRILNQFTWLVTAFMLTLLVIVARDALLLETSTGYSGYGVYNRVQSVEGAAMSRSSGMARFAAIPGVIALAMLFHSRGIPRLGWLSVLLACGALIYILQSRGAMAGFAFASAFLMVFLGPTTRRIGIALAVLTCGITLLDALPPELTERVTRHITRGQSAEQLQSMTGRTRAWQNAWVEIWRSPAFGWGFQADRHLIATHVHNTYMYTLICFGFVGTGLFVAGLVWSWVLFFRLLLHPLVRFSEERFFLVQTGAVLAFFTVRSIPEVCGPLFGVDMVIMVPVLLYWGVLWRHVKRMERVRRHEQFRAMPQPVPIR